MKLATIRITDPIGVRTQAVRLEGDLLVEIPGVPDVGALLAREDGGLELARVAEGPTHVAADAAFAPVVPHPGKVICVGMNYRAHIAEMKRDMPEVPTLFTKFADSLIGAFDPIPIPPESALVDWEGELTIVIGRSVRRVKGADAEAAIAGYTIANDVSMRDWQYRTQQWIQGKAWSASTPIGPYFATPDEIPAEAEIVTVVDGAEKQRGEIHDLVHGPAELIEYISTFARLYPGDLILTGTPSGVGHARDPQEGLVPGGEVSVTIDGIGTLVNPVVAERA